MKFESYDATPMILRRYPTFRIKRKLEITSFFLATNTVGNAKLPNALENSLLGGDYDYFFCKLLGSKMQFWQVLS